MAYRLFKQASPAATTATELYEVGTTHTASVSAMFVCNSNGVATTFRIQVVPNGDTAGTANAIYYDAALAANTTLKVTDGGLITINAGDSIWVYAGHTKVAFSIFGDET